VRAAAAAVALVLIAASCNGNTESAQDITPTSARLTFWGSSRTGDADVYFEYGTTTALGSKTPIDRFSGVVPGRVYDWGKAVGGLTPGTRYYFRACGKEHADATYSCNSIRKFITTTFSNPVRDSVAAPVKVGDPKVVRDGGAYYLSGSGCGFWSSTDLRTFQRLPSVCGTQAGLHPASMELNPLNGTNVNFFGTEVAKVGSQWVLVTSGNRHYPARGADYTRGAIWMGLSSNPGGPYTWVADAVVQEIDAALVDPSIFVDPSTRRIWMTWTQYPNGLLHSRLRVQELDPTSVSRLKPLSSPVTVLSTEVDPQPTEVADSTRRLVEGQGVVYRDGTYHLYYGAGSIRYDYASRGGAPYTFNVATTSAFPVAISNANRFRKPTQPTLGGGDGWRLPGHGAVFQDGDGTYWGVVSPIQDGDPTCESGSIFCTFTRTVFVQRMTYLHASGRFTVYDGTLNAGPIGVAVP